MEVDALVMGEDTIKLGKGKHDSLQRLPLVGADFSDIDYMSDLAA